MVYKCEHCGKPTLHAYKSSDGIFTCLCPVCSAQYEKEIDNSKDSDAVKESENRMNKKIQTTNNAINALRKRLEEHEQKMGKLEKRIEFLEDKLGTLAEENVKKIKNTIKEQLNAKKSS